MTKASLFVLMFSLVATGSLKAEVINSDAKAKAFSAHLESELRTLSAVLTTKDLAMSCYQFAKIDTMIKGFEVDESYSRAEAFKAIIVDYAGGWVRDAGKDFLCTKKGNGLMSVNGEIEYLSSLLFLGEGEEKQRLDLLIANKDNPEFIEKHKQAKMAEVAEAISFYADEISQNNWLKTNAK